MSLKWPPVLMRDFVNLLCIESHGKQDEQVIEEMVRGHIDKVEKARRRVEAPGSGRPCFHGRCVRGGDRVSFSSTTHW